MDNNSVTASKQFTLAVTSNLAITTISSLPDATVGSPYARSLSVSGGVAALRLDLRERDRCRPAGTRSGQQRDRGYADREWKLRLHTAGRGREWRVGGSRFFVAVSLPPLPSVSIDGLPDPTNAADQPVFSVSLATSYPVQLTGTIVVSFAADAEVAIDDSSIQFPTGGRTVNFTIPAGSTTAVFSTSQMALQTGTVAGTITLNLPCNPPGAR